MPKRRPDQPDLDRAVEEFERRARHPHVLKVLRKTRFKGRSWTLNELLALPVRELSEFTDVLGQEILFSKLCLYFVLPLRIMTPLLLLIGYLVYLLSLLVGVKFGLGRILAVVGVGWAFYGVERFFIGRFILQSFSVPMADLLFIRLREYRDFFGYVRKSAVFYGVLAVIGLVFAVMRGSVPDLIFSAAYLVSLFAAHRLADGRIRRYTADVEDEGKL